MMDETVDYSELGEQLRSLSEGEPHRVTILANASALLYEALPELNWCGFYLAEGDVLYLGPFQGKVACTRIEFGKGVCGTAALRRETVRVENVHLFPGHIACDGASNSEIVIPIFREGAVYGVLDMDSPSLNRFSERDQVGLEKLVRILEACL